MDYADDDRDTYILSDPVTAGRIEGEPGVIRNGVRRAGAAGAGHRARVIA